MEVKIKAITKKEAMRGMSSRDKLAFEESLSFGSRPHFPTRLSIRGKTWYLYDNFGGSMFPKRAARKKAERIKSSIPRTEFLRVDAQWDAGTALYTQPYGRFR